MRAWRPLAALILIGAECPETTGPNLTSMPGYLISAVIVTPKVDTIFVPDTIRAFDRTTFSAFGRGKNGSVISLSPFSWSTSDPAIATVNESGVVTPRTLGTVEVTASADKIGKATLVILPATMSVTITPSIDTILVSLPIVPSRDTVRFRAVARDLTGSILTGVSFEWASSSPAVARVDLTGLVTAVSPGTATITVSANGHHAASIVHVIP